MGERGFWSERPREGADDAQLLATERLHALRALPYAELRRRADAPEEVERVTGPDGRALLRRTSIKAITRGGEEELRVLVRVSRSGLLGRWNPLAEIMVLASADGEMLGEYTMASEGNTPRRYGSLSE